MQFGGLFGDIVKITEILNLLKNLLNLLKSSADALDQRVSFLAQRLDGLGPQVEKAAEPAVDAAPSRELLREPRLEGLERFSGDRESVDPFLTNCLLLFALQPMTFAAEATKVAFVPKRLHPG